MVKNPPAYAGDVSLIPGLGRYSGEGSGNPLQYSCLGNPKDKGTWWATVHGVGKDSDMTEHLNSNMRRNDITFQRISHLTNYNVPLFYVPLRKKIHSLLNCDIPMVAKMYPTSRNYKCKKVMRIRINMRCYI